MKIKDLMTKKVITIPQDTPVLDMVEMFTMNRIHHIPVVDMEQNIIGMISNKDVENYITIVQTIKAKDKPVMAKEIMTHPIFSYYEDVSVVDAAKAMVDNKIHAIIVMNRKDEMVGILTSTDILRFVASS
ncbi:MAG: CBS domain-containing protein [Leptospiraceae bacterium]|nr:CBS domain-containing protein [Leptospiraceae bacterium]